jgi:hypothetical protein
VLIKPIPSTEEPIRLVGAAAARRDDYVIVLYDPELTSRQTLRLLTELLSDEEFAVLAQRYCPGLMVA